MASKRSVGADVVRTWFLGLAEADRVLRVKGQDDVALSIGKRGKLSENVITAFQKANRGQVYVPGFVEPRKITGKVTGENGRERTVSTVATLSELRAWAKAEGMTVGDRGRIAAEVQTAFAARQDAAKPRRVSKAKVTTVEVAPVAEVAAEGVSEITV